MKNKSVLTTLSIRKDFTKKLVAEKPLSCIYRKITNIDEQQERVLMSTVLPCLYPE